MNGIKYVRPGGGFEPNITLFEKSDINGDHEIPLYTYLKVKIYYSILTLSKLYKTNIKN